MQPHAVTAGTISTRLAELANRAPGRMAIENGDVRVTRAQLDADVTATARQIVAASEGRPGNVGLFFEDRIAAVRSIIGAGLRACRTTNAAPTARPATIHRARASVRPPAAISLMP